FHFGQPKWNQCGESQRTQAAPEQVDIWLSRVVIEVTCAAGGSLALLASPSRLVFSAGSFARLYHSRNVTPPVALYVWMYLTLPCRTIFQVSIAPLAESLLYSAYTTVRFDGCSSDSPSSRGAFAGRVTPAA